jgi:hypothetical protein
MDKERDLTKYFKTLENEENFGTLNTFLKYDFNKNRK